MGIWSLLFGKKSAPTPVSRVAPERPRDTLRDVSSRRGNEMLYLLDRSGSMSKAVDDLVKAVNANFEKGRGDPLSRAVVCHVVTFDSLGIDKIRQTLMRDVPVLSHKEVAPRGATPLNDAIGYCIDPILDAPQVGRKILVIFTDGFENDSKKYKDVRKLRARIEEFQNRGNLIIFLAANLDAQKLGAEMGVPPERSMNTRANGKTGTSKGLMYAFGAAALLGSAYWALRPGEAQAQDLGFTEGDRRESMGGFEDWQDQIQSDIDSMDLSAESVFNLEPEVATAIQELPADFDPAKGSLDNPASENYEATSASSEESASADTSEYHSSHASATMDNSSSRGGSGGWGSDTSSDSSRRESWTPSETRTYTDTSSSGSSDSGGGGGDGGGGGGD